MIGEGGIVGLESHEGGFPAVAAQQFGGCKNMARNLTFYTAEGQLAEYEIGLGEQEQVLSRLHKYVVMQAAFHVMSSSRSKSGIVSGVLLSASRTFWA